MIVEEFLYILDRAVPYIVAFSGRFLGALLIFLIGYIIALIGKSFIIKIANICKINEALAKTGWKESFKKVGIVGSEFLGNVIKWMLIFTAFMLAIEHLEWLALYSLLYRIVFFLPSIFIAIIGLFFVLIIGSIIEKLVIFKAQKAKIIHYTFLASLIKWIFLIFAFGIILSEIGIGENIFPLLMQTFIMGIVIAFAIAFGLAFGLGGKEAAAKFLEKFKGK